MKSFTAYTSLATQYIPLASDNSNVAIWLNDSIRTIANLRGGKWKWLEVTEEQDTVASQRAYEIPNNIRKLMDVYVEVGAGSTAVVYTPQPVFDPNAWKLILAYKLGESDVPLYYYVEGTKVHFAPVPASSGNNIVMRGRLNLKDLSIADYTTGGVLTATDGSASIVGTGTSWTAPMAGRYLRITDSDTANKGDGFWYPISSIGSTTTLTLTKPYQGTSIAAGNAAYIIGQMCPIPEAYDPAPIYRMAAQYWASQREMDRANYFWRMYDGGVEAGLTQTYGGLIGQMLENEVESVEGPYISPLGKPLPIDAKGTLWSPWNNDASGF